MKKEDRPVTRNQLTARGSTGKLRVGLISAAWGAHAHLPAWRSLEDVEVVGICTSRRETAEKAASNRNFIGLLDDFTKCLLQQNDANSRMVLPYNMPRSKLAACPC